MFVLAQVSSMKTSLEGSRSSWLSRPPGASRRPDSLSHGRTFCPGDAVAREEAPQRADAEAMPARCELRLKLFQRDVAGLFDEREDQALVRIGPRRPAIGAALLGGRGLPVSFCLRHQRIALAAETPNRSAACGRDTPPETAATTRSRRSSERFFFDMPAGLLRQQTVCRRRFGNPSRFIQTRNRSSLAIKTPRRRPCGAAWQRLSLSPSGVRQGSDKKRPRIAPGPS